jgi:hypothetical protein
VWDDKCVSFKQIHPYAEILKFQWFSSLADSSPPHGFNALTTDFGREKSGKGFSGGVKDFACGSLLLISLI